MTGFSSRNARPPQQTAPAHWPAMPGWGGGYGIADRARPPRPEHPPRNHTVDFLRAHYPHLAGMVDAGMPVAEAFRRAAVERKSGLASDKRQTSAPERPYTFARFLSAPHSNFNDAGHFIGTPTRSAEEVNASTLAARPADPNLTRGALFDAVLGLGGSPAQASFFTEPFALAPLVGDLADAEDATRAFLDGDYWGAG